ncbi:uncharacterized protein LY89DRAFT_670333 [Mollisia scopiformis]|uniref:Uncharacterized protein n=1 Tax=Mollisia scopiformis TaxID=149040 RepID=A0A194X6T2_MOLSC|nr:uncharacterized protein LY89DRAFT_670333 [Mollisia scopiformis]KUJ15789.1 hypothetical protein LY89DRAFT_670333 [Mollisia scopiformis]
MDRPSGPSLTAKLPPMPVNQFIANEEVVSGALGPLETAVDAQPFTTIPSGTERPWYDLRTFLNVIRERAERIGLRFSRGKPRRPRRPRWLGGTKQGITVTTSTPEANSPRRLRRRGRESQIHDQSYERHSTNDSADIIERPIPVQAQGGDPSNEVSVSRLSAVFMTEDEARERAGVEVRRLSLGHPELFQPSSSKPIADNDIGIGTSPYVYIEPNQVDGGDETTLSRRYSETEHPSGGYAPPHVRHDDHDDDEFVSSAVMVKDRTGNSKAVKMFYDTMTAVNWVSECFASTFGLELRPILREDLKVYKTINATFIPRHYVELQLQNESLGMEGFTTLRCNVTPSMDGIGLMAGRQFMKEYRVIVDANARRDIFVTTSSKANAAQCEARKQHLEQSKKEYEKAKELSASTAGPSTQQSAASTHEPLAPSSRTSTHASSSDIKQSESKG